MELGILSLFAFSILLPLNLVCILLVNVYAAVWCIHCQQEYIKGEKTIERRTYRVQDVCRKSRTWNVAIDQSEHSDLQTFGAYVCGQCSILHA